MAACGWPTAGKNQEKRVGSSIFQAYPMFSHQPVIATGCAPPPTRPSSMDPDDSDLAIPLRGETKTLSPFLCFMLSPSKRIYRSNIKSCLPILWTELTLGKKTINHFDALAVYQIDRQSIIFSSYYLTSSNLLNRINIFLIF